MFIFYFLALLSITSLFYILSIIFAGLLYKYYTKPDGCTENKFFWYQLKFGRKWLLGGRKLDSAHISPGRGAGEQLSGVKQSYREEGPQHPIPDRAGGHSPPLLIIWDINGPCKGLPPIKRLLGPRLQTASISHYPHGADRRAD